MISIEIMVSVQLFGVRSQCDNFVAYFRWSNVPQCERSDQVHPERIIFALVDQTIKCVRDTLLLERDYCLDDD